jgi:transposase-like protein
MADKIKYKEWLEPQNLIRIQGWARDGLTEADIAKNMGIVTSTLWEWKKKYQNISNALKVNKDIADRQVENALFKAAIEGNTTAQIFWLKNRKRLEWRDKQEFEHNIKDISSVQIEWIKDEG